MSIPRDRGTHAALRRTAVLLGDLARLHRKGRFHGGVCPGAIRSGAFGISLRPPGWCEPPVDYRDPERARDLLRDPKAARRARPRNDLFGIGALLYSWPPPRRGSRTGPWRRDRGATRTRTRCFATSSTSVVWDVADPSPKSAPRTFPPGRGGRRARRGRSARSTRMRPTGSCRPADGGWPR